MPKFAVKACFNLGLVSDPYVAKDDELRCIFFHVPKAAGTSIRQSAYQSKSFHIPATRYRAASPKKFDEYFKFCFVRNPWDRLLSAYEYLKVRCNADMAFPDHRWAASNLRDYRNFEHFVLSLEGAKTRRRMKSYIHFRDQLDWIADSNKSRTIMADFVGRYETISEDYEDLQKKLNLRITLPVERKRTCRMDYRQLYTTKMIDIVSDTYAEDIRKLGYSFE